MIPAKMRELFPEGQAMILVKSLDKCINLYTEERWGVFEEKINALAPTEMRKVSRFFYGSMQDVMPDAQGRVLLPLQLRETAGIARAVVIVGCGDHAEIWDEETYDNYARESRTEEIEEILRRNGL